MENTFDLPFNYIMLDAGCLDSWISDSTYFQLDLIGTFLCTQGEISGIIGTKRYAIKEKDIFFFSPSSYVRIVSRSNDFRGIVMTAKYDFAIPLINRVLDIKSQLMMLKKPCIALNDSYFEKIRGMMVDLNERIGKESSVTQDSTREKIIRELILSKLNVMAYEIVNIFFSEIPVEPAHQDRGDIIVQKFLMSVYRHFRTEHDVAYYAKEQCLTSSYFSFIVKGKTKRSASVWIIEMIINESKELLTFTNMSIKEISSTLGFPTQSFFGKYFKTNVGLSPKSYRLKTRKL